MVRKGLKEDMSYRALSRWNRASVNRDFVDLFDYEGEVELAEVRSPKGNDELVVMQEKLGTIKGVGAHVLVAESGPVRGYPED